MCREWENETDVPALVNTSGVYPNLIPRSLISDRSTCSVKLCSMMFYGSEPWTSIIPYPTDMVEAARRLGPAVGG